MTANVHVEGDRFFINGRPTYKGVSFGGSLVEGLLLNSRMVQALFDDENAGTAARWVYPDTGRWDADRNTAEFCAALAEYRRHGLLAVTVGLQGGGSIYTPDVYDHYVNTAYEPDGTFKPAYFARLRGVIEAADAAGMVVIVNYFYWKQAARLESDDVICRITAGVTDWLLETGYRNLLVDVMNEVGDWYGTVSPILGEQGIHRLVEIAQQTTRDGRRLLIASSTGGGGNLPVGRWQEMEDLHLPHGNGLTAEGLRAKLRRLKDTDEYRRRPRPIVVNEDSVFIENLDAAVEEGCSWGFYCQGYGSQNVIRFDWTTQDREPRYEDLSGFQTVPVNWSINTPLKRAFFDRIREITCGSR
jgi:hypothetical protein